MILERDWRLVKIIVATASVVAIAAGVTIAAVHFGSPEATWFYCRILRLCTP